MATHTQILKRSHITPPDTDLASIEVPVLTGAQRQGDIGIWPTTPLTDAMLRNAQPVPPAGTIIVTGETTGGNAHILHADGPVLWLRQDGDLIRIGTLHVPVGAAAHLIHTDEHGVNSIGPGTYQVTGKREQSAEIRRVAD